MSSLNKKKVDIAYGAKFGPDGWDAHEWSTECISFIDGLNRADKKPNPKVSGIDHRHIPLETLNRSVGYSGDLEKMVSKNSYISNKANLLLIEKPS